MLRENKLEEKIEIIQVLRFVAATGVMLYHCSFGIFKNKGYFGVDMFFVISGFLIMYSTQNNTNKEVKSFLVKRIRRIIPLYWFATICMYFIISIYPKLSIMSEAKIIYLIKSMLFIPFVNEKGYSYPILPIGWTLNYEIYFYIIFAVVMKISFKYRAELCMLVCFFLMGVGVLIPIHNIYFDFLTSSFLLEFILGIVIYKIYYCFSFIDTRIIDKNKARITRVGFSCSVILAVLLVTNYLVILFPNVDRCFTIGIPTSLFF